MRRPRKVLCSIGAGPHAELLARSGVTFRRYAERHGYDVSIHDRADASGRPPAWARVLLVRQLLNRYDVVLWIDADAAVTDMSADIADLLGPHDLMGLVAHTTSEGDDPIPNCGVWLLRSHRATRRFLNQVWGSTGYVEHRWWENAAVLDLLGYELEPRVRLAAPSRMLRRTTLLATEWNSIPADPAPRPRIVHFPGLPLDERRAGLEAALGGSAP